MKSNIENEVKNKYLKKKYYLFTFWDFTCFSYFISIINEF